MKQIPWKWSEMVKEDETTNFFQFWIRWTDTLLLQLAASFFMLRFQSTQIVPTFDMSPFQRFDTRCDSLRELFLIACKNGEEAQVKAALVLGVDINFKSDPRSETGLMLAIRGNHEGVVDILLTHPMQYG